jgi:hypothetical protein
VRRGLQSRARHVIMSVRGGAGGLSVRRLRRNTGQRVRATQQRTVSDTREDRNLPSRFGVARNAAHGTPILED